MAHILSRIDLRTGPSDAERKPAIPLETLYVIADGMSKAFAKAGPDQEIVVMSIQRDRHWGVFDRRYLTSLVAFVRDDLIYLYLVRSDWEIPNTLKTDLPEPRHRRTVMTFRLVPSEGMTLAGPQAVAVVWRDPIFQRPTRTRILPSGKVVRREVLMESPEDTPGSADLDGRAAGEPRARDAAQARRSRGAEDRAARSRRRSTTCCARASSRRIPPYRSDAPGRTGNSRAAREPIGGLGVLPYCMAREDPGPMKKMLVTVVKTLVTVGIFVSLFVEFGGGTVAVSRSGFADGSIFYRANPATAGLRRPHEGAAHGRARCPSRTSRSPASTRARWRSRAGRSSCAPRPARS